MAILRCGCAATESGESRQPRRIVDIDADIQWYYAKNRIHPVRRPCHPPSRFVEHGEGLYHAPREHRTLETGTMSPPHVIVIGGGLAGLAASVALADQGVRVSLFEKNPRLGGRATSYRLSSGEYIDNCQHVTLRCCTNLEDFFRRAGVADKIGYYDELLFS